MMETKSYQYTEKPVELLLMFAYEVMVRGGYDVLE